MLTKADVYTCDFMDGRLLVETKFENIQGQITPYMDVWFQPTKDYGEMSFIVGLPIADNSPIAAEREIEQLIDSDYIPEICIDIVADMNRSL